MIRTLITLFCLFASVPSFAGEVMMKVGVNNSWFATEGGTSETKPALGIGILFPLDKSTRVKFGIDAMYVEQKMILKDKSWPSGIYLNNECRATFGDLYLHYHYLKMPVYFNCIVFQSHNISANFSVGLSVNLTLESSSSGGNRRAKEGFCDYDYERVQSDRNPKYPAEFIIGTGFYYKNLGLDLLYSYTLGKTEYLYGLSIRDNIHSVRMMLNWRFKKTN